ncbi:hypothetical protein BD779DRAFT_1548779 [Infundibulicybe gibba]|nr:hypothetical protein BD779DRAFT_1548779 [Infundibulicybe gibba]
MSTLAEFLSDQENLVKEAALALPHEFSRCTHSLGPIRQAVYLCLTCAVPRGLCSACSIACHTNHDQIELFPKRNFRCDCPTTAIPHPCTLHTRAEEENVSNMYGPNFRGVFCRCGRPYDPKTEVETMIQCLSCEDWFHESCCNLRERPPLIPVDHCPSEQVPPMEEDATSEASSLDLPPPLISSSDYESFVCGSCVLRIPTLKRWAGTLGVMMVVRNDPCSPWSCLGDSVRNDRDDISVDSTESLIVGTKRSRSVDADHPDPKRARLAGPQCLAPPSNLLAEAIFGGSGLTVDPDTRLGTGDVFLTCGFQERWCHCPSCLPSLKENMYLLEEEETYEPPEDPDSGLSFEALGMRALEKLPRDRAIEGIHAFNEMRDNLVKYLRPFAQEGKVVGEADVKQFFDSLKETEKAHR